MAELAKMAVEGSMAHTERIEADGVYRLLILGGRRPLFVLCFFPFAVQADETFGYGRHRYARLWTLTFEFTMRTDKLTDEVIVSVIIQMER